MMTPEELNGMPSTAHLMNEQELLAWLASRKEVGEAIEVEAADLKGEWVFEEAPYQLHHLFPSIGRRNHDDSSQQSMRYFVRSTQSRGWIGERDLTEEKKKVVRCRVEERERAVEEFHAERKAAALLIDVNTCEIAFFWIHSGDPYGIQLAPGDVTVRDTFVRGEESNGWIWEDHLPHEKPIALRDRIERERLARQKTIDDLLQAVRLGGDIADVWAAIEAAKKLYGEPVVKDALEDYGDPLFGPIGGHLIERGYLTLEHARELLAEKPQKSMALVPK
jgi:hypothetical protein